MEHNEDYGGSLVWGPAVLAASHKRGPAATARLTAETSPEASSPLPPRLFSPMIHPKKGHAPLQAAAAVLERWKRFLGGRGVKV